MKTKNEKYAGCALIVTIPPEAFSQDCESLAQEWEEFLEQKRPAGAIFYTRHFENKTKDQAKKMLDTVRNILGNCFLAADQEGGRVQRLYSADNQQWHNCPSAEKMAGQYELLCSIEGEEIAKSHVLAHYRRMFKDMRELGLNMTLGPNCDINFYKDREEYQQCLLYRSYWNKKEEEIREDKKPLYEEARLFKEYLQKGAEQEITDQTDHELIKKFQKIAPYSGYIAVVGDRSYSRDPELVATMASLYIEAAKEQGVFCVPKHAPGHGRPLQDSHVAKASTDATKDELIAEDLLPYRIIFRDSSLLFAMPSHVTYTAIDPKNTAASSEPVLALIEEAAGKRLIFISDDLGMQGAKQISETGAEELAGSTEYRSRICDIMLSGNRLSLNRLIRLAELFPMSAELYDALESCRLLVHNAQAWDEEKTSPPTSPGTVLENQGPGQPIVAKQIIAQNNLCCRIL